MQIHLKLIFNKGVVHLIKMYKNLVLINNLNNNKPHN